MIFVGLDVHVRNAYLHVSDQQGQRLSHGRVGNTLAEFAQFLGPIEGRGPIVASLESTTNSRAVVRLLEPGRVRHWRTLPHGASMADRGPRNRGPYLALKAGQALPYEAGWTLMAHRGGVRAGPDLRSLTDLARGR